MFSLPWKIEIEGLNEVRESTKCGDASRSGLSCRPRGAGQIRSEIFQKGPILIQQ